MSTMYPAHTEVARYEIARRLRVADDERRRRLVRQSLRSGGQISADRASR
ncbi:hypothetical protein SAMN04487968_11510 [Nocardioides terrae]|uniref:Uncharacterized protein n=1 Tax=Nocardioides terrae TaxID=574651 RepID=A0A1I1NFA7_9ACTN|nr:hypothetical protein SAMN04487968_11510 [Nocardioides terrae]